MKTPKTRLMTCLAAVLTSAGAFSPAFGQSSQSSTLTNLSYVDWTSAIVGANGSAIGSIVLTNLVTISVTYEGDVATATQTEPGRFNFWTPSSTFLSSVISNLPPVGDIIALTGGTRSLNKITFSEPVEDPILLIASLGSSTVEASLIFDAPFTLLSQGPGPFGSGILQTNLSLTLSGLEGSGAIQFSGVYTNLSWIAPVEDFWTGFTVGLPLAAQVTAVPEGHVWISTTFLACLIGCGWARRKLRQ